MPILFHKFIIWTVCFGRTCSRHSNQFYGKPCILWVYRALPTDYVSVWCNQCVVCVRGHAYIGLSRLKRTHTGARMNRSEHAILELVSNFIVYALFKCSLYDSMPMTLLKKNRTTLWLSVSLLSFLLIRSF